MGDRGKAEDDPKLIVHLENGLITFGERDLFRHRHRLTEGSKEGTARRAVEIIIS